MTALTFGRYVLAMIIVAGTITIDPTKRDFLSAEFEKMRAASLAEDGCHEYQLYFSRTDPATVFMFEKWESEDALGAHMATPHMAEFGAAMGGAGVSGTDIAKYTGATEGPLF